jgi:hypothetical protein
MKASHATDSLPEVEDAAVTETSTEPERKGAVR